MRHSAWVNYALLCIVDAAQLKQYKPQQNRVYISMVSLAIFKDIGDTVYLKPPLILMTEVMSMQKVKVRGQRLRSQMSKPHLAISGP